METCLSKNVQDTELNAAQQCCSSKYSSKPWTKSTRSNMNLNIQSLDWQDLLCAVWLLYSQYNMTSRPLLGTFHRFNLWSCISFIVAIDFNHKINPETLAHLYSNQLVTSNSRCPWKMSKIKSGGECYQCGVCYLWEDVWSETFEHSHITSLELKERLILRNHIIGVDRDVH